MRPVPFTHLLHQYITEYNVSGKLAGVPVYTNNAHIPIGPAAGPHTQLAENIVAAYAAGAEYMELKTVQVLESEELGIQKPCIYAGHEVFNTEWSTELTVAQASAEYIKAYLLIAILSKILKLTDVSCIKFVCSVGYDLKGIQSQKVDRFLNEMKSASNSDEWKRDIEYIKEHISDFPGLIYKDIEEIENNDCISDTVTLSTLHGCPASEIGEITKYLLCEKGFNTFIKMNPTLIGEEKVRNIWKNKGYKFEPCKDVFEYDLKLDEAVNLIKECREQAKKCGKEFGVKFTNTFPVMIQDNELAGDRMYLSGAALYPISIAATAELMSKLNESDMADGSDSSSVHISYSGGADIRNIKELLLTGMKPVTMSSILLQPGGYKNITSLLKELERQKVPSEMLPENWNLQALSELAKSAETDERYDYKPTRIFERQKDYDKYCGKCNNCVDVCPNRANIRIEKNGKSYVLHQEALCNSCGCCVHHCIMGHVPYLDKFTIFEGDRTEDLPYDVRELLVQAAKNGQW